MGPICDYTAYVNMYIIVYANVLYIKLYGAKCTCVWYKKVMEEVMRVGDLGTK